MRYTRLGRAGPVISNIGLGSLALASAYGRADPVEADRLIRDAIDAGVTLLDTADFYAAGQTERLVGHAVAGRTQEVLVCTRGGVRLAGRVGAPEFDARPDRLERACDASLRRLGVECVGLYFLHCQDVRVPIEESVERLACMVRAGKIRYLGLSGCTPRQLRRAQSVHPITALGVEYSLARRDVDPELLTAAREQGVGVVAARPLCRGLLAGRLGSPARLGRGDWRRADPRFRPDRQGVTGGLLRSVEATAARLDLGAGRLALGWLLAQGEHIVPVPSTRDRLHLEMNIAASAVELPPEARHELAALFPADASRQPPSPLL